MNITYLVGNGFDLYLGMKTSPKDFLQGFIEENEQSKNPAAASLAATIKSEGIDTWADFEMGLGKLSQKFSNTEDGVRDYLEQVEALETHLHQWLLAEDERMTNDRLREKADMILSSFTNILPILSKDGIRIQSGQDDEYNLNFICFNYTSTLKRALLSASKKLLSKMEMPADSDGRAFTLSSFVQPHGTLDTVLICGVDGVDQISNPDLQENGDVAVSIVKSETQRADNIDFDLEAMRIIDRSNIVCIFGMSLGKSDRRWWQYIANLLISISSPLYKLVIFSYDLNGTNLTVPPARIRKKDRIKEAFLASAETNDAVTNRIKTQIQVFPASAILPNCV